MSAPRRAGANWERRGVALAVERGLPWTRRLRLGEQGDLLDVDGCLPAGWLVGFKGIRRGVLMGDRMSDAMNQCDRAMAALAALYPGGDADGRPVADVIPVQVLQRAGYGTARAYTVMEYGRFLDLVTMRQEWDR